MAVSRLCNEWLCMSRLCMSRLCSTSCVDVSKAVLICRELCQYVVSFADMSDGLCRCVLEETGC